MNKHEAAVISAYSGIMIGHFDDMHKYIEEVMGRPVFTSELGSDSFMRELKLKVKPDLMKIHESITH